MRKSNITLPVIPVTPYQGGNFGIIDADPFLYIISASRSLGAYIEEVTERPSRLNALKSLCTTLCKDFIRNILTNIGASHYVLCVKGSGNFRNDDNQFTLYKGTRPANAYYNTFGTLVRDCLIDLGAIYIDNYETDDLVYTLHLNESTYKPSVCKKSILCSIDKDMLQCPGYHYNYQKHQLYLVTPDDAEYNLVYQLLIGDKTDNIKGIGKLAPHLHAFYKNIERIKVSKAGVGEKGAEAIIDNWKKRGFNIEDACRQLYIENDHEQGLEKYKENLKLLEMVNIPIEKLPHINIQTVE